ncbi:MAG: transcriptional repressor [Chromatiales bacterium]|jgi:Fur family transcriptional regulator, zinc uptake regulator|nr:transcriptional repressor [Chromatiales bacterium]
MQLDTFLADHDHRLCVDDALARAELICAERGARLTALRRQVLAIVWNSHRPIGAYDVLEQITTTGRRAAPPTVYRALDFLLEHALVHRLDSLNAFVGCAEPGHGGHGQFLLCRECGTAAEIGDENIHAAIDSAARQHGFSAQTHTVEIAGVCPNCQRNAPV